MTRQRKSPIEQEGADSLHKNSESPSVLYPDNPAGADPVGLSILNDIHNFIGRFVAYPSEHAHVAHTLWLAHTHNMDVWDSTPRLAAISPEPECGKSRVLEISEVLVPRPVESVNVTPAYLFRKVADEEGRPTILYDEIDTVFGPKARDNEEIRGLLNAGHRRRAPSEIVHPWRRRMYYDEGNELRERLSAWASSIEAELMDYWPVMPPGIEDRAADVWEALLAMADKAGGEWPECARAACVALVAESRESTPSLGLRLLKDLKDVFGANKHMSTTDILNALYDIDEAPWDLLKGRPLDARGLAVRLRPYNVRPKDVRIEGKKFKGYSAVDLWDSWERYVPTSSGKCATSATSAESQ